jgi:hypothetical protein
MPSLQFVASLLTRTAQSGLAWNWGIRHALWKSEYSIRSADRRLLLIDARLPSPIVLCSSIVRLETVVYDVYAWQIDMQRGTLADWAGSRLCRWAPIRLMDSRSLDMACPRDGYIDYEDGHARRENG